MAPTEPPRTRARIDLIDVARGAAMLLVFLSHFLEAYYDPFPLTRPHAYQLFTRVASPAFVCISGLTLAVLFARNRDRFGPTRDKLIDRGLFLLLVGHPLFTVAYYFMQTSWQEAVRVVFITDTIGFAVIAGALLVTRVGPRGRLALGLTLLVGGWAAMAAWNPPVGGMAWRLKDFLVGDWREPWLTYNFPPVPWFGLYLVASAAGAPFARAYEKGEERSLPRKAATVGMALLLAAVCLHWALRQLAGQDAMAGGAAAGHVQPLVHFASPLEKVPPSPTYFLTYVGVAALMLAGLMLSSRTRLGRRFADYVVLFGRNSLSAFLFQFYVYYFAVSVIPRPPEILLPAYFLLTIIVLRWGVRLWEKKRGNRFITVGFGSRWGGRAAR